jgi:hypothetical protein
MLLKLKIENAQKLKAVIGTIFFVLLFGFLRPHIVGRELKGRDVAVLGFIFFLWLCYSFAFANTFQVYNDTTLLSI